MQVRSSDFSGGNVTSNVPSFAGNMTNSDLVDLPEYPAFEMSDLSENTTDFECCYDTGPRDFSGADDEFAPDDFSGVNDEQTEGAVNPDDFSDNSDIDLGNETGALPPDFAARPDDFPSANCETTYPSAACLVAQDLISLSPDQIRSYGLSDKPDYVVEQTLNILDPGNLTKVLQSISPEEISSIKTVITPEKFDNILSRIPEPQHNELVNIISVPP